MSPKLIQVHLFRHKRAPEAFTLSSADPKDDDTVVLLNPRRVDYFMPITPPTSHPNLYCGTRVCLGSKQSIVIREPVNEVKRLLK